MGRLFFKPRERRNGDRIISVTTHSGKCALCFDWQIIGQLSEWQETLPLKKNRPSLEPMGISGHCHIWGQPRSVPLENSGQGRTRSWPLEMSLGAWMGWGDEGEQDLLYRPVRDTASGSCFQTFSLGIIHASLNSNLVSISPFQRRHIWRVRRGPASVCNLPPHSCLKIRS